MRQSDALVPVAFNSLALTQQSKVKTAVADVLKKARSDLWYDQKILGGLKSESIHKTRQRILEVLSPLANKENLTSEDYVNIMQLKHQITDPNFWQRAVYFSLKHSIDTLVDSAQYALCAITAGGAQDLQRKVDSQAQELTSLHSKVDQLTLQLQQQQQTIQATHQLLLRVLQAQQGQAAAPPAAPPPPPSAPPPSYTETAQARFSGVHLLSTRPTPTGHFTPSPF